MSFSIDVFSFIPPAVLQTLHWLAGLVVFAEGLNKLERTDPLARGLCLRRRGRAEAAFGAPGVKAACVGSKP